jgi:hypothetical protein
MRITVTDSHATAKITVAVPLLGKCALNALFHEPRLRLQVYGDARRPHHP